MELLALLSRLIYLIKHSLRPNRFFSDLQQQPLTILQPLKQQEFTMSHLKVLTNFEWYIIRNPLCYVELI